MSKEYAMKSDKKFVMNKVKGWGFSGAAIRGGSGFAGPPTS